MIHVISSYSSQYPGIETPWNIPNIFTFSGTSIRPYTGAVDCVYKMVSAEGFRSLYRGMGGMVYLALPRFAIIFHANALGKKIYR